MKKQLQTFIWIFLVVLSIANADEIKVKLNRTKVGLNESFNLIFSSNQNTNGQPDFSPLQDDFEILSNSQSFNTSMINGAVKQERTWNLVLMPKHAGQITIPSIQFGQQSSPSKTIEVSENASADKDDKTVFLEAEVNPKSSAYEQTQLIYTIRIFTSVNISNANLSTIQVNDPDAIIEQIGNDAQYEYHHQNGINYSVFERKYSIIPQHVGELVISPISLTARAITNRMSLFDYNTQHIKTSSNAVKIQINPIPAPFHKNNWLAAYDVNLIEEWSADPSELTIGEPITLTFTVKADGCLSSQIPDIPLHLPQNLKQYYDSPQNTDELGTNGNIGIKQIKVALIATAPGEITIPEIKVKWWDLKNDRVREAQLPERKIQILSDNLAMETPTENQKDIQITQHHEEKKSNFWIPLLVGLNLFWILVVFFLFYKKKTVKSDQMSSLNQVMRHLKNACQMNDAKKTEECLLALAMIAFPKSKVHNILDMKQYFSESSQILIDDLYQSLYGQKLVWQGSKLWEAIKSIKFNKGTKKEQKLQEKLLKDLYPSS